MPRVKPHAKLHCSLGNHAKTADVFADNELLATYARILMLAVERFADRHGDTFILHRSEFCSVTGRSRVDYAAATLARLVAVSPLAITQVGARSVLGTTQVPARSEVDRLLLGSTYEVTVPNFSKKQGFGLRKGAETEDPPTPAPAPTPTPSPIPSTLSPPSAYGLGLSQILKRGVLKIWPNCQVPTAKAPAAWARTIDKMLAKGRTHERIQAAIVWLYTENRGMEPEETFTIQSAAALNKKFDRVEAMMQKGAKPKSQHLAREKREQEEADERRREREAVTRERAGTGGAMAGDVLKTMGLEVVK